MKSIRYILPIALLAASAPAFAQSFPEGLGVRTAMEISVPSGGREVYGNGAGFTVGLTYKLPFAKRFTFEPELLYYYSTMTCKQDIAIDGYEYEGSARSMGIRVPLMVSYNFPVHDNFDITFATGPWLNFNVYARQNILPNLAAPVPVPDRKINLFDHGWKKFDAQWGFKLYMTFAHSYFIGITGGVAFTPLASFGMKDKKIRVHRNTVAISLGYNF